MKTMSADKVAPLVVYLLSDASKLVSGQIFAVRKNEIVLFSVPRPIRTMHKSEGWTPESIATELAPAFASSFHKLERTGEIFPYEPI